MNNVKDWFIYRRNCPLCENVLTTYLHSDRRQSIRFEDNKLVVLFPLDAIKGKGRKDHGNYKVGYAFSFLDNTFCIEFYDKNNFRIENEIPAFLLARFRELNKNLTSLKFYKECGTCHRYFYSSNNFVLDLQSTCVEINPFYEFFGFAENYGGAQDDRYRIYRLVNWLQSKTSYLSYGIDKNISHVLIYNHRPVLLSGYTSLDLPLIKFVSKKDTLKRIKKLITFS